MPYRTTTKTDLEIVTDLFIIKHFFEGSIVMERDYYNTVLKIYVNEHYQRNIGKNIKNPDLARGLMRKGFSTQFIKDLLGMSSAGLTYLRKNEPTAPYSCPYLSVIFSNQKMCDMLKVREAYNIPSDNRYYKLLDNLISDLP